MIELASLAVCGLHTYSTVLPLDVRLSKERVPTSVRIFLGNKNYKSTRLIISFASTKLQPA